MTEEIIIRHCSPTLAGLKTANMFACPFESNQEMCETLRDINKRLSVKGVRALPLRVKDGKALIYIFRPHKLKSDMEENLTRFLLEDMGYRTDSIGSCLSKLAGKLNKSDSFPHEIGLFLGYPPRDVLGFMLDKSGAGVQCKNCIGCWKVYGNEDEAEKAFSRFKKCTRVYLEQYSKGSSIEKLTVKAYQA